MTAPTGAAGDDSTIAISLRDVAHSYGGPAIVDGIDLAVVDREFVSIVGPSGCGKSTLLRIAAGLVQPSRGCVSMSGAPVIRPGPDRVLVQQKESLFPWRSALKNVEFGLEVQGVGRAERRRLSIEMLATVGLSGFEHRVPSQLSGGMRQRCQIARALVLRPKVLLLDEPLSALDWQARRQLQDVLLELTRDQTTLLVTHDIDEAAYLSDRVVVLSGAPAHVVEIVELGHDRAPGVDVRRSPAYQRHRDRILDLVGLH